jgi:hypothetical protein
MMTRYATTPLPTADEAEYTLPGATNRQLDYIASLLQQREVKPETAAALGPKIAVQMVANEERGDSAPAVDGISKKRASESISKLLELPKRRNELPARPAKTREIGACSVCGKRLTNSLSRLLDIGPVCGGRFWDEGDWKVIKVRGRDALRSAGLDPKADAPEGTDFDAIREQAGL